MGCPGIRLTMGQSLLKGNKLLTYVDFLDMFVKRTQGYSRVHLLTNSVRDPRIRDPFTMDSNRYRNHLSFEEFFFAEYIKR